MPTELETDVDTLGQDMVFVVSTGRCGSTLISHLVGCHPDVLSLSELFGQLYPFLFLRGTNSSGTDFWNRLTIPNPLLTVLIRNRAEPKELLYPRDGKWFDRSNGIPAIMATTLPHLTNDPDAEFASLDEAVPAWSTAPIASQFNRLFATLGRHNRHCRIRVERSGASLLFVGDLIAMFPKARLIHVYRNGMDSAWSMRMHPVYRLLHRIEGLQAELTDHDATAIRDGEHAAWRSLCEKLGPADINAKPPVSWFGAFWSRMILNGLKWFHSVPPDRILTINYESLSVDPTGTLPVIAHFLGVKASREWLDTTCNLVRPARRERWHEATEREQSQLARSCEPGTRQLRRFLRNAPPWSLPPATTSGRLAQADGA